MPQPFMNRTSGSRSAGKGHKTGCAVGFNNGLYRTSAGRNK